MRNKYEIRGETTAIFLKRRDGTFVETLIDTEDLRIADEVQGTWIATKNPLKGIYVHCGLKVDGKRKIFILHRMIMRTPDDMVVDHINHNTLDNRKSNLRNITDAQNKQNKKLSRNNKSGIRGVSWSKRNQKWYAAVHLNGKTINLGWYEDLHEAGKVVSAFRANHMPYSSDALNLDE